MNRPDTSAGAYARAASVLAQLPPDDPAAVELARETVAGLLNGSPRAQDLVRRLAIEDRRRAWGESAADAGLVVDAGMGAETAEPNPPVVRTLAEILEDPDALRPPEAVAPRLAWAGRSTVLAGPEKSGKTTFAGAGAAAVSRGGELLGDASRAGDVLVVEMDAPLSDLVRQLVAFGAAPERVHLVESLADPLRQYPALLDDIRPALVVVDSLIAWTQRLPDPPESGDAGAWDRVMRGLIEPAREVGAALVVVHHARRSDGRYRDSSAIGAAVDMILELSEAGEAGERQVRARGRWAVPDYRIRLMGDCYELVGGGELSMDARVLAYVERHPGCSQRDVERGVTGRVAEIRESVRTLLSTRTIEDRGDGSTGRQLHAAGGGASEVRPGYSAPIDSDARTASNGAENPPSEGCVPECVPGEAGASRSEGGCVPENSAPSQAGRTPDAPSGRTRPAGASRAPYVVGRGSDAAEAQSPTDDPEPQDLWDEVDP